MTHEIFLLLRWFFRVLDTLWYSFRPIRILKVVLLTSSTWKIWKWNIIWIKITYTHNHVGAKSYPHGMKFWSEDDIFLFLGTFLCIFWPIGVLKVVLSTWSTWKLWEWIIIWIKITETHNHIGVKSCPHGINFWSKGNFFLFLGTFYAFLGRLKS